MPIQPMNGLIPEHVDPEIAPTLNAFSDALNECANFASNLFVWEKYKTNGDENIPPVMLLRHAIELVDSISLLIRNSHTDPAKLQLRSLLETHFKLLYMLEADTDDRAMAFLVDNILRDIGTLERMIEMEKEQKHTRKSRSGFWIDENTPLDLQATLASRQQLLTKPKYIKAFAEFTKLKGKFYPPWHQCFGGEKTILGVAKKLRMEDLYTNIYSMYSSYVHGTDVFVGKMSGPEIYQIRLPQEAQTVTRFAIVLFLKIIRTYIEKRVPQADVEYKNWFQTIGNTINKITGPTQWIRAK